jgi:hypothetical protein
MPRVVPSDVVSFIQQTITARNMTQNFSQGDLPALSSLLALVDRLPNELLSLPSKEFTRLLVSLETVRAAVRVWQSATDRAPYWQMPPESVGAILELLSKCPDEAPSLGTHDLMFIAQSDLRDSIRIDMSTAHSDLAEGKWKGATVLAGSAAEALLLWALQEHESQNAGSLRAAVTALVAGNNMARPRNLNPENWELQHYIPVAHHLGLIEDDTATQANLARNYRNLIHPGRAARLGQTCDRSTAHGALAAMEGVARDVAP